MSANLHRLWKWALESEGSTRPAALIRIGLALILWARFGQEVALFHNPHVWRAVLMVLFSTAVTFMLVGFRTRLATLVSAGVVGAMHYYAVLFPERSAWFSHHVYLLFAFAVLSALTPAGRSFSVDRWLECRRARQSGTAPPLERGNLWAQRLMMIQIGLVYFWSAVDKTGPGYFSGARLETIFMHEYFQWEYPHDLTWFHPLCVFLSWLTLVTEYTLAFGLFFARLRPWCMVAGILFHGAIYLTIPVSTFSVTMILLYIAFFDADTVHRTIDEMLDRRVAA